MEVGAYDRAGWMPAGNPSVQTAQAASRRDSGGSSEAVLAQGPLPEEGNSADATRIAEEKAQAKVMEEQFNRECQTCKNRKYQDGSNDPGVSFKSAQYIDPALSASVVAGHEMEHVAHEQARAKQDGGEVLFQSVRLHGAFCPECGRYYVAGGVTETVTRTGGRAFGQSDGSEGGGSGLDITA